MKYLNPIPLKDKYYRYIREEINRIFYQVIYKPVLAVLDIKPELRNTGDAVYEAIRAGDIWYENGEFYGKFNSRTSKRLRELGARWNFRSRTFSLRPISVPPEYKLAQADANDRFDRLRRAVLRTLADTDIGSINQLSDLPDKYNQTITWMNDDFAKAVRSVAIPPQLTDAQRNVISAEWSQNLDLYIKKWSEENILQLRQDIETNAFGGRRPEALAKYIAQNYQVSRNKAEFLARQETSLLMSKFHEVRYASIAVTRYKWSTSGDVRVRHDHKLLNGQIFSFSQPPVVERRTGRRANPGEDFGCFPGDTQISIGNGIERIYRFPFQKQVIDISAMGFLTTTINHPILTTRGWIPAGEIRQGDYLIKAINQAQFIIETNKNQTHPTFDDLFTAFNDIRLSASEGIFNFYGDVPDGKVDIISFAEPLTDDIISKIFQGGSNFSLSDSNALIEDIIRTSSIGHIGETGSSGLQQQADSFISRSSGHADIIGGTSIPTNDIMRLDNPGYDISSHIIPTCDSKFTVPSNVFRNDFIFGESGNSSVRNPTESTYNASDLSNFLAENIGTASDSISGHFESGPIRYEFCRVENAVIRNFSGHVYTVQSLLGWYGVTPTGYVVKNCRCIAIPILE